MKCLLLMSRDPSADVKLNLAGVAGRQCRIIPCGQTKKMWIEVLDDSCGETRINDTKVSAGDTRELCDADILTVTDRQFRLFYAQSAVNRQVYFFANLLSAKGYIPWDNEFPVLRLVNLILHGNDIRLFECIDETFLASYLIFAILFIVEDKPVDMIISYADSKDTGAFDNSETKVDIQSDTT